MSHKTLKTLLFSVSLLCCQLSGLIQETAAENSPPRINGTFIQLFATHKDWKKEDWEKLFFYFKSLHISYLIVQWSAFNDVEFFSDPDIPGTQTAPLDAILNLADANDMKIFLGLSYESNYWDEIQKDLQVRKNYFIHTLMSSRSIAKELSLTLRKHPSFQGWYIPQEIDDINWVSPDAQRILFAYLRKIKLYLHKLTPDKAVAISGFSNAARTPKEFEKFWSNLLRKTSIDLVLFQDGIGAHKLNFETLPLYLKAIHNAVHANSKQLQVIVEVFEQTSGYPVNNDHFTAQAASWNRIQKQMAIDSLYSSQLIAFSVPEYMTPLGVPNAEELFNRYLEDKK